MQVIDARDPLTYRSNDLEQYARDIAQHKGSLLLLNKADLLSAELRTAWADYFDERGVSYVFWSAKAAADALKQDAGSALTLQLVTDPQPSRLHNGWHTWCAMRQLVKLRLASDVCAW